MRWGALVAGIASALGCAGWQPWGQLPDRLKVTRVLVEGPEALVMGFIDPGGGPERLSERAPRVFRVSSAGVQEDFAEGTGWVQAGDTLGGEVWALRARIRPEGEGSLYDLLVRPGPGAAWEARGPVPASSLAAVVIEGGGCGWALGVRSFLRTCDGGATWTPVEAPGARSGLYEPLITLGPQAALLGGRSLQLTRDGGATWRTLSDRAVAATDGHYAVARLEGGLRVGRVEGDVVTWLARYDGEYLPSAVTSSDDSLLILAVPTGSLAGRGLLLLRSDDGGASLTAERSGLHSNPAYVGLGGPELLLRVDLARRVAALERPPSSR